MVDYYIKIESLTEIPRGNEALAREFCKKMDWDYLGYNDRYAWSSEMATYIRGTWAVASLPDGQRILVDKEDIYERDG